jgi:hypothetical protein
MTGAREEKIKLEANFAMRKHCVWSVITAVCMFLVFAQSSTMAQSPQNAEQWNDTKKREIPIEEVDKFIAKSLAGAKPTIIDATPGMGSADTEIKSSIATGKQTAERELAMMRSSHPASPPASPARGMNNRGGMTGVGAASPTLLGSQKVAPPAISNMGSAAGSQLHNPALACSMMGEQMRVATINGLAPPTFRGLYLTPDSDFNLYTLNGCNFGAAGLNNKAWIYGKNLHGDFQIQFWSDNQIAMILDPRLSGVLDQDNVSLVLQGAHGQETKIDGLKFYAARSRQPILLNSIPNNWVKLAPISGSHFYSPAVANQYVASSAVGSTAAVYRYQGQKFAPGGDDYDFSHLAPGWGVGALPQDPAVQLFTYPIEGCPGIVTYHEVFGAFRAHWTAHQVHVDWADYTCSSFVPPPCGFIGCYSNDHTVSAYALKVYINGPRCTDPHKGLPDQLCIQRVKQGLEQ